MFMGMNIVVKNLLRKTYQSSSYPGINKIYQYCITQKKKINVN